MRFHWGLPVVVGLALGLAGFAARASRPQTPAEPARQYEHLIDSVKGADLYHAYCAQCHGAGGRGDGTALYNLRSKPADLTVLARNNGGRFPEARVRKTIAGEEPTLWFHSQTRDMPDWGPIFHQIEYDQDFGDVRIQNLVKYLESMQRK